MDNRIVALKDFLDASHSVYHAVAYLEKTLAAAGYTYLSEGSDWTLTPGGKYYTTRGGAAVIAFRIPENTPKGFMLSAAHADRPCFKVKENGELAGKYTRLAVERYGGMLLHTWLDKPLSIAGRVLVETETGVESKLVDIDRDLLLIPNVAIHMGRRRQDPGPRPVPVHPAEGQRLGPERGIYLLRRPGRSGMRLGLHPGLPECGKERGCQRAVRL